MHQHNCGFVSSPFIWKCLSVCISVIVGLISRRAPGYSSWSIPRRDRGAFGHRVAARSADVDQRADWALACDTLRSSPEGAVSDRFARCHLCSRHGKKDAFICFSEVLGCWSSGIDIIDDVCHVFQVSQQTFQWMEARMAAMLVGVRRQLLLMYKFSKRYAANLPETWPTAVCSIVSQQVFSLILAGAF